MSEQTVIQVFKPWFGDEEVKALEGLFKTGWIGLGPKTAEFERRFAEFCGVKYAVGLNSGTAALDMAMKLLGVNRGDEVIVPTMTFVSTAQSVAYNLASPIFADIDPVTMGISLEDVKRKISPRTKAIIAVHYGGRPVDMDALKAIAGDIPIVEDCAHATGTRYKGKPVGSLGEMGCFSFHAVKNLAMGDGGALTLSKDQWYERSKRLRWLGITLDTWDRTDTKGIYKWKYSVDEIGYKCHMNDINASIGLVQLEKLDRANARRREIKDMYNKGLAGLPQVELPPDDDEVFQSSWHIYCIKCEDRDTLIGYLKERGICTGVHYNPIHQYRCFGNRTHLPVAEEVFERILTLPMYPGLTDEEVERIIWEVRNFYCQ